MSGRKAIGGGVVALGLLAGALAGCPGTLDDPGELRDGAVDQVTFVPTDASDSSPSCGDIPTLLSSSCGQAACHSGSAPAGSLDLQSPGVTARLFGVKSSLCGGTLADPSNPDMSLLMTKLYVKPPCGGRMPSANDPLPESSIECIRAWVASGPVSVKDGSAD